MTSKTLNHWIAESESWQSFIDYNISQEGLAEYTFRRCPEDFFISLMSEIFDLMDLNNFTDAIEQQYYYIARGLDVFSLEKKKDFFSGINIQQNGLFISGLYYLAGYSPSARLRSKLFSNFSYRYTVELFLAAFFKKERVADNKYSKLLNQFLDYGDIKFLNSLKESLKKDQEQALIDGDNLFILFKLAIAIVSRFMKNNIWHDLLKERNLNDYWRQFIIENLNKETPVWDFFPSQQKAIFAGILKENPAFTLQMPTSSGKTALCELVIYNYIKQKKGVSKVLFLAPFRALASELKLQFTGNLGKYGIKAKSIYGGNTSTNYEKSSLDDIDLLISTPEKFMALESVIPGFAGRFGLIICDEGHLLDDAKRGLSYELLLSRLKQNSKIQFIFISAILPNVDDINRWLNGTAESVVSSNYRPSVLEYCLLKSQGDKNFTLEVNPTKQRPHKYFLSRFISESDIKYLSLESGRYRTYKLSHNYAKAIITSLKSLQLGSVAIFCPTKGTLGVEGTAQKLLDFPPELLEKYPLCYDNEYLSNVGKYFEYILGPEYLLTQCIPKGFAFHHGDLPQNVREIIEDCLRSNKIQLVICTNTLAEGVNLPIKTIIVSSTRRYSPSLNHEISLKKRDLKNLFGRAGRAGKEIKGTVIAVNENDFPIIEEMAQDSEMESAEGFLYKVVDDIAQYIHGNLGSLSHELLENSNEEIKKLIDYIDISLISLRDNTIGQDCNIHLHQLVESTFSYFLLSKDNNLKFKKEILLKLFKLRNDSLALDSSTFTSIKNSGCSIRGYDDIINNVDFHSNIWQSCCLNDEIWNFYFDDCLFKLNVFIQGLFDFSNSIKNVISPADVKKASKLWTGGYWYWQIAKELEITIPHTLRLIHNFIGFTVQNTLSSINRIQADNLKLPNTINNFPRYLELGICSELELALIESGLNDRVVVSQISKAHLLLNIENISPASVRKRVLTYKKELHAHIKGLPQICINNFLSFTGEKTSIATKEVTNN